MDDVLQQGIAALKAGDRETARRLLVSAVRQTPDDEHTWGWLYNAANTDKERLDCLRNIVRINPKNEKAKLLLDELSISNYPLERPSNIEKAPKKKEPIHALYIVTFLLCTPVWAILMLTDRKQGAGIKTVAVIYLMFFIIICLNFFAPALQIFNVSNVKVPDATQCVKPESCFINHFNGNTTLYGSLSNSCNKPITDISLKGIVTSQLDNSILGSTTELKRVVLAPGQNYDYELTIKNSYFGELINCYPETESAYFVK